jgi:hypothetical protein
MAKSRSSLLVERIVAFRVKPAEWQVLEREATRLHVSVGQLAKRVLFTKVGLPAGRSAKR